MTRKRYIKLLMACGYSRNLVQARAVIACSVCGSYACAFERDRPNYVARRAIRDMTALLRSAWESIEEPFRRVLLARASEVAHE